MGDEKPMGQVIQIDEARIRDHLGEMKPVIKNPRNQNDYCGGSDKRLCRRCLVHLKSFRLSE